MSLTLTRPPAPPARPAHPAPPMPPESGTHRHPALPTIRRPHRDAALDFVRFACLIVVVVLHSMMSSAELGADGEVVPTVALSGSLGFTIASWFYQIMPLFFAIGGYAALSQWRRTQADGGNWADYLSVRLRRLVAPVAILIILAGLGVEVASTLGASPELIAEAGRRIGQPLWFLAVYVGLTSLIPLAARLHILAPRRTVLALAGAVAMVDALVAVTGVTGLGYLNFLLVWPLIQQFGFFFHDAMHRPVRSGLLWSVAVLAAAVLGGLVALGVYSPNMLVNLNPPTGALVLLGLAQIALLRLGHAWLTTVVTGGRSRSGVERGTRARIWDRLIAWGNTYGMHVYLWHMSVVITLIGLQGGLASLLAAAPHGTGLGLSTVILPPVESAWWWMNRPVWLILIFAASAGVAVLTAKLDVPKNEALIAFAHSATVRARGTTLGARIAAVGARTTQLQRAILAVSLAVVGIAIALLLGLAPFIWTAVSGALLLGSLLVAATLPSSTLLRVRRVEPAGQ